VLEQLGTLVQLVTSGSRDWAKYYSTEGAIFLRMGNLSRDSYCLRLSNIQRVNPPADGEGSRTKLQEGDILISITGEVGLLGLIPPGFGDAYINQHTCLVRPMEQLMGCYLPQVFLSPFGQDQFDEPQRGLKNSFRLNDVTGFLVPLPPLSEQRRIVAKVDELMALCDQLEASLTTAQTEATRLLESVLHNALQDPGLA
jgi:type I restriction enzyme S subunit